MFTGKQEKRENGTTRGVCDWRGRRGTGNLRYGQNDHQSKPAKKDERKKAVPQRVGATRRAKSGGVVRKKTFPRTKWNTQSN